MAFASGLEHIVRENEILAPYTWFRLGGPAQYFAEPTSEDELSELVARAREDELPIRMLGGGSNVLVRDEGVPGLTIHLSSAVFAEVKVDGNSIVAGGGAKLGNVISAAVREGLSGLEPLVGIPGTVGGALHGNAGTETYDIGQVASEATVLTRAGEVVVRSKDDLRFSYRQSSLDELVILRGRFDLEPADPAELTKKMKKVWIVKKSNEPQGQQTSGMIFKSPGGVSAAKLIDQAGLKGTRVGEAAICEHNANFLVADSNTTSADVLRLIELVRDGVKDRTGVDLELQIEIW